MADAWWLVLLNVAAILVLTFLSATFSGLDLGLMSMSPGQLELLIKEAEDGDENAKRKASRAKKILPVRRDGNLLLCTVLLGNVAVNSCMAVFLDSFTGGALAFVITTLLVVTFGEIIPQSLCYKHGLLIGAKLLPILKFFRLLFYPVNKPVALLLDKFFGEQDHSTVMMNGNQMVAALDYQMKKDPKRLSRQESSLLKGSLQASDTFVKDVMVKMEDVLFLESDAILDSEKLKAVSIAGYSKLPVVEYVMDDFENKNSRIIGILHVSDLLGIDAADAIPVKILLRVCHREFQTISGDETLLSLLRTFRCDDLQLVCVKHSAGDQDPHWYHSGIVVAQDVLTAIAQEDLMARTGSKASKGVIQASTESFKTHASTESSKTKLAWA